MNLTPEQLARLRSVQGNSGYNPNTAFDEGGRTYQSLLSQGTGENGLGNDQLFGYASYDPNHKEPGQDTYSSFDAAGAYDGERMFRDDNGMLLPMGILAALSMGAFLPGMMAGGATGGAAGAVAGDAFMPGMLGAGGSEVAFGSVIPGLESFVLPAAGGAAGGAAGASGANPGYSFMGGDATMPGALGANGVNMSTAALPGMSGNLANGAGSSLLSGGAKSLLGPAATLLGGAAGAQGQENEQSTTRDVPEWLKPYVTKNLEYAGGLLDKQMQPGYLQGYDDMRTRGQSLLNAPMAGNGFPKFFPGRG
jgi:hypothetical protein